MNFIKAGMLIIIGLNVLYAIFRESHNLAAFAALFNLILYLYINIMEKLDKIDENII